MNGRESPSILWTGQNRQGKGEKKGGGGRIQHSTQKETRLTAMRKALHIFWISFKYTGLNDVVYACAQLHQ